MQPLHQPTEFPQAVEGLMWFLPAERRERLKLPNDVPEGIKNEFEEAERCMDAQCFRAAGGMFRSVLDKTMRANGYKTRNTNDLYKQIEAAAADGIITDSRRKKAHDEIRSLGNDILHEDWQAVAEADVELAHHYAQRILEDFYDDRPSVLASLVAKQRLELDGTPV